MTKNRTNQMVLCELRVLFDRNFFVKISNFLPIIKIP